jgi:hypothetical protein
MADRRRSPREDLLTIIAQSKIERRVAASGISRRLLVADYFCG